MKYLPFTKEDLLDERVLIPYVQEAASKAAKMACLEGTTKADALLLAPETGVAVIFEATVLPHQPQVVRKVSASRIPTSDSVSDANSVAGPAATASRISC